MKNEEQKKRDELVEKVKEDIRNAKRVATFLGIDFDTLVAHS